VADVEQKGKGGTRWASDGQVLKKTLREKVEHTLTQMRPLSSRGRNERENSGTVSTAKSPARKKDRTPIESGTRRRTLIRIRRKKRKSPSKRSSPYLARQVTTTNLREKTLKAKEHQPHKKGEGPRVMKSRTASRVEAYVKSLTREMGGDRWEVSHAHKKKSLLKNEMQDGGSGSGRSNFGASSGGVRRDNGEVRCRMRGSKRKGSRSTWRFNAEGKRRGLGHFERPSKRTVENAAGAVPKGTFRGWKQGIEECR